MPDYIFKTYLADGREHFLYGEMGDSRAQLTKKDFPFPESLLRLLYLDVWAYDGQIKQFDKLLMELYRTREEKCARQLLPLLDELAELHIYFQLLRLDWRARFKEAQRRNYENILDLLPHKEITHIPSNIHAIQNQVLGLVNQIQNTAPYHGAFGVALDGSPDFAAIAGAYGIPSMFADDEDKLDGVLEQFLSAKGSCLLICKVHPDVGTND